MLFVDFKTKSLSLLQISIKLILNIRNFGMDTWIRRRKKLGVGCYVAWPRHHSAKLSNSLLGSMSYWSFGSWQPHCPKLLLALITMAGEVVQGIVEKKILLNNGGYDGPTFGIRAINIKWI